MTAAQNCPHAAVSVPQKILSGTTQHVLHLTMMARVHAILMAPLWLLTLLPLAAVAAIREGVIVTGTTEGPNFFRPEGKCKGTHIIYFLVNMTSSRCFIPTYCSSYFF